MSLICSEKKSINGENWHVNAQKHLNPVIRITLSNNRQSYSYLRASMGLREEAFLAG